MIKEGNEDVPFFFSLMNTESQIKIIEQKVSDLLADEPGYFLVEIRIKPAIM